MAPQAAPAATGTATAPASSPSSAPGGAEPGAVPGNAAGGGSGTGRAAPEPCKKQACDIQKCLARSEFQPSRCVVLLFYEPSLPLAQLPLRLEPEL